MLGKLKSGGCDLIVVVERIQRRAQCLGRSIEPEKIVAADLRVELMAAPFQQFLLWIFEKQLLKFRDQVAVGQFTEQPSTRLGFLHHMLGCFEEPANPPQLLVEGGCQLGDPVASGCQLQLESLNVQAVLAQSVDSVALFPLMDLPQILFKLFMSALQCSQGFSSLLMGSLIPVKLQLQLLVKPYQFRRCLLGIIISFFLVHPHKFGFAAFKIIVPIVAIFQILAAYSRIIGIILCKPRKKMEGAQNIVKIRIPLRLYKSVDPDLLAFAPSLQQLVSGLLVLHQLFDLLRELLLSCLEVMQHLLLPQLFPAHFISLLPDLFPLPQQTEPTPHADITYLCILVAIYAEFAVDLGCLDPQHLNHPLQFCFLSSQLQLSSRFLIGS